MAPRCTASMQRYIMKSTASRNSTFSFDDHDEKINLESISITKHRNALENLGLQSNENFGSRLVKELSNTTSLLYLHNEKLIESLKKHQEHLEEAKSRTVIRKDLEQNKIFNYILSAILGIVLFVAAIIIGRHFAMKKLLKRERARTACPLQKPA